MRLTKALFEMIVGTLLALYALGTDAHMNGSGTDAAQAGKMYGLTLRTLAGAEALDAGEG